jgi:hypothetical protein
MSLKVDMIACGMGAGEQCCAWLVIGEEGAICGREEPVGAELERRARAGEMSARRLPDAPYPLCQL